MSYFSTEKNILIPTSSGGQLDALVATAKAEAPAVAIMCHPHSQMGGSMQNKVVTTTTRAWHQLGFHTIRFNFRGVGTSTGEYDAGMGEQEDLADVVHWALTHFPQTAVIMGGFSFGAYVALRYCQQYTPDALLLIAPPIRYQQLDFSSLHIPRCPAYLIAAEADEVVSTQQILDWAKAEPFLQTLVVAEASHFFHGKLLPLRDFILQYFSWDALHANALV